MVNKLRDFEALNWSTIASNNESDQVVGHKIPLIRFGKEQPSSFSRVYMDRSRTGQSQTPQAVKAVRWKIVKREIMMGYCSIIIITSTIPHIH